MARPVVAVLRTKPETILDDYARLLDLAKYRESIAQLVTLAFATIRVEAA